MSVPLPGFVQVLKNLNSSGILFDISLALESPRKRLEVLESTGNLLILSSKVFRIYILSNV